MGKPKELYHIVAGVHGLKLTLVHSRRIDICGKHGNYIATVDSELNLERFMQGYEAGFKHGETAMKEKVMNKIDRFFNNLV